MQDLPVPIGPSGGAIEPAELVKQNITTVVSQFPDIISYDPTTDRGEMLSVTVAVDPGIPALQRDGWRGTITEWGIAPWEVKGNKEGEIVTVPSLVLIGSEGDVIRLTGWPAIRSWSQIVKVMGKERCQLGVSVVVKRRPSGTAGRSYWIVVPDA